MPRKPAKPLSEKPSAVRARLRKTATKVERDVTMLYKPIEEWDMEELARGRPRNKNGNFSGPRPAWINPLIIKEAQERLRVLTRQELSVFAGDAVRVMHQLMTNDEVDFDTGKPVVPPATRLQAATYVLDQTIGKATLPVDVTGNVVLDSLLADVLVNDEDGELAHPVIDGEVAAADEDDDEDGGE